MNTVDMWKVLGIEPTKDENEIVAAYRNKVVTVNPEDDAEGFMRLREAFELAVNYAREDDVLNSGNLEDAAEEQKNKSEVDIHIDKLKAIYEDIYKRRDISLWEEWLGDSLCTELDTSDAVREALLVFIMGHFLLPYEVWKLIDKTFSIVQDKAVLQEMFPPDFLSFVEFHILNEGFVDFQYIEDKEEFLKRCPDYPVDIVIEGVPGTFDPEEFETKIDSYLRHMGFIQAYNNNIRQFEIEDGKNAVDDSMSEEEKERVKKSVIEESLEKREKEIDTFCSVIEYLDSFPYIHCMQLAAKINALKVLERYDDARRLAEFLLFDYKLPEGTEYETYTYGTACYFLLMDTIERPEATTEEEKARIYVKSAEMVEELLNIRDDSAMARLSKSVLEMKDEEFENANDTVISVLDRNSRMAEAVWLMKEINRRSVEVYKKRYEDGTASNKDLVELAWSYFRIEDVDSVFEVLDKAEPEDETFYAYNNLYGRCYHIKKEFNKALPYLKKWVEMMDDMVARSKAGEKLSKKDQERISRNAFCYYMYASCLEELEDYEQSDAYYNRAIAEAKAGHGDQNELLFYQESYGKMLNKQEKYDQSMEIWNEMIASIDHCVPAYIHRQETAHKMRDAQLVIDDYYNIIRDYPQYDNAYVLAARVFYIYNQDEDVKSVLKRAKDAGIENDRLRAIEAKILDGEGKKDEALVMFQNIDERIANGESDMDEPEVFYGDYAALLLNIRDENGNRIRIKDAEIFMNKALKIAPKNKRLLWLQTDIEEFSGRESEWVYDIMLQEYPDDAQINYEYAEYLKRKDRIGEAKKQYLECLNKNPNHKVASNKLMNILQEEYMDQENREAYEQAVKLGTHQLDLIDDSYYRIERALLYLDGYELDKAEADARKAIEFDPQNVYAHNALGLCFLKMRKYPEAAECFLKSIEVMKDDETPTPFMNAARCFESMGEFRKAIEYVEKCIEKHGITASRKDILARLHTRNRDYASADRIYIEIDAYYKEQRKQTNNKWYDFNIVRNMIRRVGVAHLSGDETAAAARLSDINKFLNDNGYNSKSLDVNSKGNSRKICADIFRILADFYLNDERNYKNSIYYFEKVIRFEMPHGKARVYPAHSLVDAKGKLFGIGKKSTDQLKIEKPEEYATSKGELRRYAEMYRYFAGACYAYGIRDFAAEMAKRALACLRKAYGSVEGYVMYAPSSPLRISDLGMIYFFEGRGEEAFKYVEQCTKKSPCDFCNYGSCYDKILAQARMAELSGDIPKAIELFKLSRKISNNDVEVYMALRALAGVVED